MSERVPVSREEFYSLMNKRISNVNPKPDSNALGTALYIAGEIDQDKHVRRYTSRETFEKMKEMKEPERGYIVGWFANHLAEGELPFHTGVITNTKPLEVAERKWGELTFSPNKSLGEVEEYLTSSEKDTHLKLLEKRFFVPSKLQKIIDKESIKERSNLK